MRSYLAFFIQRQLPIIIWARVNGRYFHSDRDAGIAGDTRGRYGGLACGVRHI